jgi:hypothetical protein
VTAPPDSNGTGSRHPRRHGCERCVAGHGQCRTVKDRLGVKGSQVRILSSRRLGQGPLNRHIPGSAGFSRVLVDLVGWSPIVGVSIFRPSWEEFGSIACPVAKWGRVWVCEANLSGLPVLMSLEWLLRG